MNRNSLWQWGALGAVAVLSLAGCSQHTNEAAHTTASAAPAISQSVKLNPGGVYELAYSPADDAVYVASVGSRGAQEYSVAKLDADTLKVESRIALDAPVFGIALDRATHTLYGTNTPGGSVQAIDLDTGKVVATIKGEDRAHLREVVVDAANHRAYVSALGRKEKPNAVWVIDTQTNTLLKQIVVDTKGVVSVALDTKQHRLFAVGMGANDIVVINLDNDTVVGHWASGGEKPMNAVYDSAVNRLFVANSGSGTLTVLDGSSGKLLATVDTGAGALDVDYDSQSQQVYVTNRKAGTTTVVNAKNYKVVAQLKTGTYPQSIAIDAENGRVYISNKAKSLPRNAPKDAVPPKDPNGDTVVLIRS